MIIKLGKGGKFLSCEKFPDCQGARTIDGKELQGPKDTGDKNLSKLSVKQLKELLEQAIKKEAYEEASRIRDEIAGKSKKWAHTTFCRLTRALIGAPSMEVTFSPPSITGVKSTSQHRNQSRLQLEPRRGGCQQRE